MEKKRKFREKQNGGEYIERERERERESKFRARGWRYFLFLGIFLKYFFADKKSHSFRLPDLR
jgi:hypothetical protein